MITNRSIKQSKFLKAYCETLSLSESARRAGYKCNSLKSYSTIGRQVLDSLELTFPEILKMQGVTPELLAQTTYEGLHAKKTVLASYEGKFLDERELVDHLVRHKFTELASKLMGYLKDKMELSGPGGGDILLEVHPGLKKEEKKVEIDID